MIHKIDTQCPNCGHAMRLVRTVPRLGALPKLQSSWCYHCHEVVTEAIDDTLAAAVGVLASPLAMLPERAA
jgi:hypothetical protein